MLYAFGGRNHRHGSLDSVEMLDTWHGRWVPCPPMPARRAGGAAAVLPSGKIVVVGGYDERGIVDGLLERCDVYDPVRRRWEENAVAPMTRARWGHGCATLRGLVYAVGGCSLQEGRHVRDAPREAFMETLKACEVYHPKENVWRPCAPLQIARSGSRVVAIGDRHLLAVGGCDDVFGQAETQPTAELFDVAIGRWSVLKSRLSQPRTTAAVAAVDGGRVVVFGGAPSLASAEVYHVPQSVLGGSNAGGSSSSSGGGGGPVDRSSEEDCEVQGHLLANLPVGRMGCQAAAISLPAEGADYPRSDHLCVVIVGGERCGSALDEWPRVQQFANIPVFDVAKGAWRPPEAVLVSPLPSARTAVLLCVAARTRPSPRTGGPTSRPSCHRCHPREPLWRSASRPAACRPRDCKDLRWKLRARSRKSGC
mmetsp:Transcript_89854/g.288050  ORF Transcript_89854/g.288050 Transcript_89854/m.288050 type:complete len:423 (+) Transcript_89854:364-1632(+)